MKTLKTSHFPLQHKNQINSDPYTEIKLIPTTHTENKSILMHTQNQVISCPHTRTKSISTTAKKPSQSIPTIAQVIFGPHTKNQVNFDPYTK